MRKITFLLIVIILVIGIIASCAPQEEVSSVNSKVTPTAIPTNMKLVGQATTYEQVIQVWKVIDDTTTCYITMNKTRYEPSAIYCVNK